VSLLLGFFSSVVNPIVARCSPRKSGFLVQKAPTVVSVKNDVLASSAMRCGISHLDPSDPTEAL